MGQLNLGNLGKLGQKTLSKLVDANKRAIEGYDFDQGWVAASSPVKHRLGITPKSVIIQVSSDRKGASWTSIAPDSVTDTEISYTTALPYVRVLANK